MLQDLAAKLSIQGLPDWVGLVALLLGALVALAYLLMPFSVFGVKGRLDAIETHLDEIQTEIRSLALRLPEPSRRRAPVEDEWVDPPAQSPPARDAYATLRTTPPIPPQAAYPDAGPPTSPRAGPRTEPRLDWPRGR